MRRVISLAVVALLAAAGGAEAKGSPVREAFIDEPYKAYVRPTTKLKTLEIVPKSTTAPLQLPKKYASLFVVHGYNGLNELLDNEIKANEASTVEVSGSIVPTGSKVTLVFW